MLQQKIFSRWVGQKLAVRKIKFESVLTGFSDGVALVALVEVLSESKMPGKALKPQKMRVGKLDSANRALTYAFDQKLNMKLKPSAENIVDGDEKGIMSLVWAIMLRFLKFTDDEDEASLSAEAALLMWINNQVSSYGLKASKFDKSFHSGKIYASLMHKNRPRVIDPATLTDDDTANIDKVLTAANRYFGLDRYLEPSDIAALDNKSQFVFASEFYYGIARERKKDLAARRIAKLIDYTKINDALRAEYKTVADATKSTLDSVNEILGDRTIGNTMATAVAKLDRYYSFKKDDKKKIVGGVLKLETLASNLIIRLEDHKRPAFKAEDGKGVAEFKEALVALDKLELERGMELVAELSRQKLLVQLNKQHTARFEKFQAWSTQKSAYLAERETITSSGAGEFQLNRLASYEDEAGAMEATTCTDLRKLGAKLQEEKYEDGDKVAAREAEVKTLQGALETATAAKQEFLDDALARNQFKEGVELVALKYFAKADQVDAWVAQKKAYLETKEAIGSVNEAQLALSSLDSYEADKKDLEATPVPVLQTLGKQILESTYKSPLSEWKFEPPAKITDREASITAALAETLPAASAEKRKTLEADLSREIEKERLRLQFANQAGGLLRFAKATAEDYEGDVWFGEDLEAVTAAKAALDEEDAKKETDAKTRRDEAAQTLDASAKMGVESNPYTDQKVESLDESVALLKKAVAARNERYAAELARVTANDALCKEFGVIANPLMEAVDKNRVAVTAGAASLEEEQKLLESLIAAKLGEAEVKSVLEVQAKMDAANIAANKHSKFTSTDVTSQVEQYTDLLASKLEQVQERIKAEASRGITAEQLAEIDSQFSQFDKNGSKTLDKGEFKACLYSLGEERPTSEVKAILAEKGDGKEIPYEGFKAFMLELLGDTETKEEILEGFKLLAVDEPVVTEEQLSEVFPDLADVEYLKKETPKDGEKLKYPEWTEAVFAR